MTAAGRGARPIEPRQWPGRIREPDRVRKTPRASLPVGDLAREIELAAFNEMLGGER
jgi:hypothetical protein